MTRKRHSAVPIFLAVAAASAASGAQCPDAQEAAPPSYATSADENYALGVEALESGNCPDAESYFERVMEDYPYSRAATLSRLGLADCDFEQGNFEAAATGYKGFIERYPSDEKVDYATFRRGLSYFNLVPSSWFIFPASYTRDQTPTREALRTLRDFTDRFPSSEYVEEARARIRDCLAELARSELSVAEFYLDHDEPAAAAMRARTVLRDYGDSGLAPTALLLLGKIALEAGEMEAARGYFALLAARYPESHERDRAQRYLRFMEGTGEEP